MAKECSVCGGSGHSPKSHDMKSAKATGEKKTVSLSPKRGTSNGHLVYTPVNNSKVIPPGTKVMSQKKAEKQAVKTYEKTKAGQVRKY